MTRGLRLVLAGTALLALLAVVALASHAHRPGGGVGGGSADGGKLLAEYFASVLFVLFPIGALIVLWVMSMGRRQKLLEGGPMGSKVVALVAVTLLVLPVTLLARHYAKFDGGSGPQAPQIPSVSKDGGSGKGARKHQDAQFQWLPALIAGSLVFGVAGCLAIGVVAKRRRGADWQREADVKHALDEVLADTLDDLRAERDPRKAVIAAYARMEKLFAAHEVPRDEAETPQEYVARVLARLQVSSFAVHRLTSLYERARFSPHTVEATMKDDAIEALEGLRSELQADAAVAA
jgi:Domain of unknown function (DUF4129)